jgi:predicted aminopeptidase
MNRKGVLIAALAIALLGSACSPAYLWQAAAGQLEIMRARRPVSEVIADPSTDSELRRKLLLAEDALRFARMQLQLPDNRSYSKFADLHRVFAVWNVFVAPEFSLEPRTWCFPISGCVAYHGYFHEKSARAYARQRSEAGEDVYVGGAAAYSTLGYFDDPLLSTALALPDWEIAGLLFHELAHQRLYVSGDTSFNESFAMAVEEEGICRWLAARGDPAAFADFLQEYRRRKQRRELLVQLRTELGAVYARNEAVEVKRAAKRELLRDYLLRMRGSTPASGREVLLNNATLAALAAYDEHVPAFRELLAKADTSFAEFYTRAEGIGRLPEAGRREALQGLLVSGSATADPGCRVAPQVSAATAASRLPAVP